MENKDPGDDVFDRLNVWNLTVLLFASLKYLNNCLLDFNSEWLPEEPDGGPHSQSVPYLQRLFHTPTAAGWNDQT